MKSLLTLALSALITFATVAPASAGVIDSDLIREGQTVTYTVRIAEGQRLNYRVWADDDAFDVDLIVRDPFGDIVALDDDSDAVPRVSFRAWTSGAYTVQVVMVDTYNGILSRYWLSRD